MKSSTRDISYPPGAHVHYKVIGKGEYWVRTPSNLTGNPIPGSGTSITATRLFDLLNLKPTMVNDSSEVALEKLRRGEIGIDDQRADNRERDTAANHDDRAGADGQVVQPLDKTHDSRDPLFPKGAPTRQAGDCS